MFDDTNVETTQQEVVQQDDPTASSLQEVLQPVEPVEDDQTKNFKQLRKRSEQIAKERDEALSRLREYEGRIKQTAPQEVESDDFTMQPDELAEGKHISKVQKQLNKLKEEVRVATTEAKLKAQYPDFDSVVSKENVYALRDAYPEIAQALNSSPDLYATAVSAYTLIKKLGINSQASQYDAEKRVVQTNAAKPKPLASVSPQQGDSPLSRANAFANGLTDELKIQLRREMEEARRGM